MASNDVLSTDGAWNLIKCRKRFTEDEPILVPPLARLDRLIRAESGREEFVLSIRSSRMGMSKMTFHKRIRETNTPLVRLEIGDHVAPHQNPDGTTVTGPHIHIYKANLSDAVAIPLSDMPGFDIPLDFASAYVGLCAFCSIVDPPDFQRAFS